MGMLDDLFGVRDPARRQFLAGLMAQTGGGDLAEAEAYQNPILQEFVRRRVNDAVKGVTSVRDAYRGDLQVFDPATGHVSDEAMGRAATAAGLVGTGGLTMSAPAGSLRMFAGRNSQTADAAALARAEGMAAQGADRSAIWNETGWFQGVDGKWRYEIPDTNAKFSTPEDTGAAMRGETLKLPAYVSHLDAYAAYPAMRETPAQHIDMRGSGPLGDGVRGAFAGDQHGYIFNSDYVPGPYQADRMSPRELVRVSDQGRSTALHEMQHQIQGQEGFAAGGSLELAEETIRQAKLARDALSIRREMDALPKGADSIAKLNTVVNNYRAADMMDLLPSVEARELAMSMPASELAKLAEPAMQRVNPSPMDFYRRQAGEVEARNVQTRRNMTPSELRARPPWETQDIPDGRQIVNFGRER